MRAPSAHPSFSSPSPRSTAARLKTVGTAVAAVAAAAVALLALAVGPRTPHIDGHTSGDADLAAQVRSRISDDAGLEAVHVSVISPEEVRHAGIGSADGVVPDENTRYDLASVTKTFTGQLMADSIARGEIAENDTAASHIPQLAGTPAGEVTLLELATHHSGLPNFLNSAYLVGAIAGSNSADESTESTEGAENTESADSFLKEVSRAKLDGRGSFSYSNTGVQLLGLVLARAAGAESWEDLVVSRLFEPVGMDSTVFTTVDDDPIVPEGAIRGRLGNGHSTQPGVGGPVGLISGQSTWTTGADLTRYAQAVLDGSAPGGREALKPRAGGERAPGVEGDDGVGYLWRSGRVDGREIYNHEGSMPWGTTYVALDPASGRAVVVLANTFVSGVEDLGLALLTGSGRTLDPSPNAYIYLGPSAAILPALGAWAVWRAEHLGSRLATGIRTADLAGWAALTVAGGPWDLVPGWTYALTIMPGAYAIARMALRWRELSWLPGPGRLRWWLWLRLALCLVFIGFVLFIVIPKG